MGVSLKASMCVCALLVGLIIVSEREREREGASILLIT